MYIQSYTHANMHSPTHTHVHTYAINTILARFSTRLYHAAKSTDPNTRTHKPEAPSSAAVTHSCVL